MTGHVACMEDIKNKYKIFVGNLDKIYHSGDLGPGDRILCKLVL
jgi:hypothetical protein